MIVLELFTQPSTVDWERIGEVNADTRMVNYMIRLQDRSYLVTVKFLALGLWTVSFILRNKVGIGGSDGITNTGNAPQVFSAVADCLRDFVSKMKPRALAFTAKQPSRQKLYDVLSQKMAAELGWIVTSEETESDGRQYVIRARP